MLPCRSMKVFIVGNGEREHALAWKVTQSAQVKRSGLLLVTPGPLWKIKFKIFLSMFPTSMH
ncbi:hypothetical protein [Coxiella-like endosymbiont of Rhipicephalus sanguineus]|uniref:hypothetical protein n=1 Tax=Coxiella-like endosymbiont of Rhipicephalus sanguineus TaxID=1955402 RepID=UPI0027DECF1C|nr:hypothetical protein [Coxiella-like endosymbiont of Rhipicephalus sanguineus]